MWCTIAIDDHGQIVVFGDFGPMVFGYHRGPLETRIAWMGSKETADSYVVEKANIGMSHFRRAMTVATAEDFEADVRAAFKDRREELDEDARDYTRQCAGLTWDAFVVHLCHDDIYFHEGESLIAQHALNDYLTELGHDHWWEWLSNPGERPIPEIGLAHAALRRAHLLLRGAPC